MKVIGVRSVPVEKTDAGRVGRQIHEQWPFIELEEARLFYRSLGHISASEGSVRVSLWVLHRVLQHEGSK